MRYVALVHLDNGDIDYINILDNSALLSTPMDGDQAPLWLRERVALLRLCETNKSAKGETIGRKFTDHIIYVYLNRDEHKSLIKDTKLNSHSQENHYEVDQQATRY